MLRTMTTALIVFTAFAAAGSTQEKSAPKPLGTWTKDMGDAKVTFHMKAEQFTCVIAGGGITLTIDADYGVTKDGIVFGRISRVDRQGTDAGPTVGELFSFKYSIKKEMMTISDLRGQSAGEARALVEGDYKGAVKKEKDK